MYHNVLHVFHYVLLSFMMFSESRNAAGIVDNSAEIGDDAAGIVDIAANVIPC